MISVQRLYDSQGICILRVGVSIWVDKHIMVVKSYIRFLLDTQSRSWNDLNLKTPIDLTLFDDQ
jgi:hypothetical protein